MKNKDLKVIEPRYKQYGVTPQRPQNSTRTTKTRILPIKVIFHFEIS